MKWIGNAYFVAALWFPTSFERASFECLSNSALSWYPLLSKDFSWRSVIHVYCRCCSIYFFCSSLCKNVCIFDKLSMKMCVRIWSERLIFVSCLNILRQLANQPGWLANCLFHTSNKPVEGFGWWVSSRGILHQLFRLPKTGTTIRVIATCWSEKNRESPQNTLTLKQMLPWRKKEVMWQDSRHPFDHTAKRQFGSLNEKGMLCGVFGVRGINRSASG